ncbi:MAG: hypothetical protein KDE55_15285 [Novosphingobium sp.]|nr:hypothetical protein [Novosphingobium sp.]
MQSRGLAGSAAMIFAGFGLLALGPTADGPVAMGGSAAIGEQSSGTLPEPPADGVMGFVVTEFVQPIVPGTDHCPDGPVLKLRDAYLDGLPADERDRLSRKENEKELLRRWQLSAFGQEGETNICSQPDMFDRPLQRTLQSPVAWGLDLDGNADGTASDDTCAHENFATPQGKKGIDNQEYRVNGCKLEWRGVDGMPSDNAVGMKQFMTSGEWTQVLILKGVDSLRNDPDVEVIYANTPDRPIIDSKGNWLRDVTYSVSEEPPRERNVLKGWIENGVLMTAPADIRLVQTWGQGGARDIRGNRAKWHYQKGRLHLTFQSDGSLSGMLAGYRPLFDVIISPSIGGAGSALVAGIDCSAELKTLQKYADGIKDPKTGKCTAISGTQMIKAIPAFVNDIAPRTQTAAR